VTESGEWASVEWYGRHPCDSAREAMGTGRGEGRLPMSQLEKFAAQYPQIYEKITGKGLLIGMHFKTQDIGF